MIVLIIEDSESLCQVWQRFLDGIAKTVRIAHNLPDGIRLMQEHPHPDVVLLDLTLPGSRPHNTLDHIAQLKEINPHAVVVVITGSVDEHIPMLAAEMGADFFERKTGKMSQCRLLAAIKGGLEANVKKRGEAAYEGSLKMLETITQLTSIA